MTYLEYMARDKLAREERMGLVYRWITAFAASAAASLVLLTGP